MNKKKIFIGIICVLVVITIVCLLVMFLNKKETTSADNKPETVEETPSIENNNNTEDLNNEETGNELETEKESTNTDENVSVKEETTSQQTVVSTPAPKPKDKNTNNTVTSQTTTKQETVPQKNTTPTPIVTPKTEDTSQATGGENNNGTTESTGQETKPETKPEETYVTNYEMIEKIRQTIINNESEYMKQYGYTIVVDSSIKPLTNPFTFTELRVKNLIRNSFGTIRIYAENYCVGGQVVMVDCYIL